jgi:hypothetical protein
MIGFRLWPGHKRYPEKAKPMDHEVLCDDFQVTRDVPVGPRGYWGTWTKWILPRRVEGRF